MDILERFAIRGCRLDADGRITSADPGLWAFLGLEPPASPPLASELFDELAGREGDIRGVAAGRRAELVVPGVRRGSGYIDLCVLPAGDPGEEGSPGASLYVRDVSDSMRAQQAIIQQRNEISLLKREADGANARLKELMEEIRQHNHGLSAAVREKTREIRISRLSVITKLARVAEFRDKETGGHIYRIGRSSVLVGRAFGLRSDDCEELFHASLLHDVGKVGIPDSILLKPGPLDAAERAVMQTHTVIGAEILAGEEGGLMARARDIARFHHERWDGRGYPEARLGEAIPLEARICSIVDVFDALLSKRPYKEAWDAEAALAFVRRESGRAFDPEVVDAFLPVAPDIVKLRTGALETEGSEGVEDFPELY